MKKWNTRRLSLILSLAISCSLPQFAFGASMQWTIADGKETLHIRLAPTDGFAGKPQRVDTDGILIPFSEVPPNLLIYEPPKGSKLIASTVQLGTALAIKTQTPEFGFVVAKQNPREIIIDFFQDPMGARWKPSPRPDNAVAANVQNQQEPRAETEQTEPTVLPQTQVVENIANPVVPVPEPSAQAPAVLEQVNPPVVSTMEGSVAGVAPQATEANTLPVPNTAAQSSVLGLASVPQNPLASSILEQSLNQKLPSDTQTVGAPSEIAQAISNQAPAVPAQEPMTSAPAVTVPIPVPVTPVPQVPEQISAPTQMPASAPAQAQITPASNAQAPASNAQAVNPFYGMEDEELPAGRALRAGPGIMYRGRANFGGEAKIEEIPTPSTEQMQSVATPNAIPTPEPTSTPPVAPTNPTSAPVPVPEGRTVESTPAATPEAPAALPTNQTPVGDPNLGAKVSGQISLEAVEPQAETPQPPQNPNVPVLAETSPPAGGEPLVEEGKPEQTTGQEPKPTEGTPTDGKPVEATPSEATSSDGKPVEATSSDGKPVEATPSDGKPAEGATVEGAPTDGKPAEGAPAVIYVDAEGNPVDPPLDPAIALPEVNTSLAQGKFAEGLEKVEKLLQQANLSVEQREEALHLRAELLFNEHRETLDTNFQLIAQATTQAYNYNQQSQRNAGALLRLGYINLKSGNIPEAEAQFNILRKQFPDHENVPLTYYYWGEHYYNLGDMGRAADEFQYILQKYANSRFAKDASLGLGRAYYQMGYYQEAFDIVDYMERRWPRFYLDYPPFLNMVGDAAFRLNKLDDALSNYCLYANLEPTGTETDVVLTRIGDIYTTMRQQNAAQVVYREAAARFPDRDGGLIAKMRLAEAAIYDDPTILGMFEVFDRPFDVSPKQVYSNIIEEHPDSTLVPLAYLKLAMWHLWQKDYLTALDLTTDLVTKFPDHALAEKAKEVALKAYAVLSTENAEGGRYDLMRQVWEKYPIVQGQEDMMSAESRISLGVSYWKAGQPDEALEAIGNFFIGNKVPVYSEMALNLALSIYLEHDQWLAIREVGNRTELWELSPEAKQNLDYALAISAENLDESSVAAPLWERLYISETLPAGQKAYAAYFLSREAERNNELEKSYLVGLDALTRLSALLEADQNQADLEKVKTQVALLMRVAERAGRLNEALQYAQRYLEYLDANDSERAAVMYRVARIHKTQGDDESWRLGLEEIVSKYPNTVYGQTAASELKSVKLKEGAGQYSPSGGV